MSMPSVSTETRGGSTLVFGGARSGKSRFAETLVADRLVRTGGEAVYVATAAAGDAEMAERITRHRADRDPAWRTVEEPLDLVSVLEREASDGRVVLVDCLTLWLSNVMFADRDADAEIAALARSLPHLAGPVVLVSNETGLGIVPDNALSRAFRDLQGRLNQAVAAAAGRVVLVAAGQPLLLKPSPVEIRI